MKSKRDRRSSFFLMIVIVLIGPWLGIIGCAPLENQSGESPVLFGESTTENADQPVDSSPTQTVNEVEVTRVAAPLFGTSVSITITPYPTFPPIEMPPVEERPDFVQAVAPREYRRIPLATYEAVPEGAAPAFGINPFNRGVPTDEEPSYRSSICARPRAALLVQDGDTFAPAPEDSERFTRRMQLTVNGSQKELISGFFGSLIHDRETETIYVEDMDYCWYAPLDIGRHAVTFRFTQTSGTVKEYTWYFEITG